MEPAAMGDRGGAAGAVVGAETRVEVETAAVVGVGLGAEMGGIENGVKMWMATTRGAVTAGEGDTLCCHLGQGF